jgi:hypothetical protein
MMALLFLPRQRCSRGMPFERTRERYREEALQQRLPNALRRRARRTRLDWRDQEQNPRVCGPAKAFQKHAQ